MPTSTSPSMVFTFTPLLRILQISLLTSLTFTAIRESLALKHAHVTFTHQRQTLEETLHHTTLASPSSTSSSFS
ncbi:hypothetical protein HMI54_011151 [Coelomomyces lativittatus]|nr:hypothetical protein HMI54_011151 [Coelomomyces lativittatus]KAJ1501094.1 hypothetical protein HMI55_003582 [Coelomomyces lativittatus]KAJ1502075.1 hypothetical protein HMI56_002882 [Coelomomyces lativittatus]